MHTFLRQVKNVKCSRDSNMSLGLSMSKLNPRGKLVESEYEEDWRTAGHTKVEYGFELTQDKDNQEVAKLYIRLGLICLIVGPSTVPCAIHNRRKRNIC